jgi:hypothetical protein
VDGGVDLAVAASVQAVAVGLARADGDRGDAAGAGELGVACEALGAGDLADQLARGQRPEAGLCQWPRCDLGDEVGDLGLERVDGVGEFAQVAELVAGDPDPRGLLGARQAPRDPEEQRRYVRRIPRDKRLCWRTLTVCRRARRVGASGPRGITTGSRHLGGSRARTGSWWASLPAASRRPPARS